MEELQLPHPINLTNCGAEEIPKIEKGLRRLKFHLTPVFRTHPNSGISTNAHRVAVLSTAATSAERTPAAVSNAAAEIIGGMALCSVTVL